MARGKWTVTAELDFSANKVVTFEVEATTESKARKFAKEKLKKEANKPDGPLGYYAFGTVLNLKRGEDDD